MAIYPMRVSNKDNAHCSEWPDERRSCSKRALVRGWERKNLNVAGTTDCISALFNDLLERLTWVNYSVEERRFAKQSGENLQRNNTTSLVIDDMDAYDRSDASNSLMTSTHGKVQETIRQ
ncbi:hypothetical protein HYFRA_00003767 [Hymenoscyphus fraxineus]|uniref:Uncharacterized protein n=1 Tax=Hymenoscyphus fraxineus TaxID=746836 RepID=A0A9N9L295_9HELO|nr:hypothetical protein HYFRA_00003767 [Hymenoscyphus fraxineus]